MYVPDRKKKSLGVAISVPPSRSVKLCVFGCVRIQVATDIDSENGPMALLARNVSANCGRTALPTHQTQPCQDGGLGEEEEEEEPGCRPIADGGVGGAEGVLNRRQGTAAPLSPHSGVCVQELRWGDGAQLAEALAKFGGCGPDIVLA